MCRTLSQSMDHQSKSKFWHCQTWIDIACRLLAAALMLASCLTAASCLSHRYTLSVALFHSSSSIPICPVIFVPNKFRFDSVLSRWTCADSDVLKIAAIKQPQRSECCRPLRRQTVGVTARALIVLIIDILPSVSRISTSSAAVS